MHERRRDLTWERWEVIAWTVILVAALFTRFYILGARVMSHDESLHTEFAWDLYAGNGYRHNPMMHGPLLFHLAALSYFLFGVNDFAARFFPALAGVALVLTPLLFRRFIGRKGAAATGLLLLISPSITYYSRYIRHDVYNMLAAVLLLWAALAYVQKREDRYLTAFAVAFAFLFTTKETAYIYAAIFFSFAALIEAVPLVALEGGAWRYPRLRTLLYAALIIAVVALLVLAVATRYAQVDTRNLDEAGNTRAAELILPLWGRVARDLVLLSLLTAGAALVLGVGEERLRRSPLFDLLVLGGTFLLPLGSAFFIRLADVDMLGLATKLTEGDLHIFLQKETIVATLIVLSSLALSALIGLWWRRELWPRLALIYYVIFTLFYTTFFTNPLGFISGLVGSLAYWMAQQGVERGGQPGYYYFIVAPLYEYLIIVLTLGGGVAAFLHAERGRSRRWFERLLPLFLFGWAVMAWAAYSVAGEKMPWLTVHLALPGAFLGGWWLGQVGERMHLRPRRAVWAFVLALPLLVAGAFFVISDVPVVLQALRGGAPPEGYTLAQLDAFGQGLGGLVASLLSALAIRYAVRRLGEEADRLVLAVVVLSLALLTVRTGVMLNYINYDLAKEFLVYAHGAPDVKVALRQIEDVSWRLTGAPHDVKVAYGEDGSWPFSWYLNPHYPNRYYYGTTPDATQLLDCPVIIAGWAQWDAVDAIVGDDYLHYDYTYLWWPIEDYKGLTWERIRGALSDARMRHALWQIIWWRDYREYAELTGKEITLKHWPYRKDFRLYVRRDVAEEVWSYRLGGGDEGAETSYDPYEGWSRSLPLAGMIGLTGGQPRDLAVAEDGSIYAADTAGHRIWHVNAQGSVLALWGGQGSESGQFQEPWGIALDGEGHLYVADTWNHRIQVFDGQGGFLRQWGEEGEAARGTGGGLFFGPRDVAVAADGRVYVADTGNKRVQVFDPDGTFLFDFGGGGQAPGLLNEPVGLLFDAQGDLWIADSWNRRVQRFDAEGRFITTWPVVTWNPLDPLDKPFLAVDGAGHIYTTDIEHRRVLVFNAEGGLLWTLGPTFDGGAFASVGGVAVHEGILYVSDPQAGRIDLFSLLRP